MKFYKPNPRMTGSACSFSVTSTGKSQGIYVEIIKQKGWDDSSKTGSFESDKEKKVNLKFTPTEVAEMMMICQRQKGSAKFFHNTGTITSSITFAAWEKDGVIKGIALSASKGDKKVSVPFTFAEAFLLSKWFDFALDRIFTGDYAAEKKLFEKLQSTNLDS